MAPNLTHKELVARWNARYPVGTLVAYRKDFEPNSALFRARTAGPAELVGRFAAHTAVIRLEGEAEAIPLTLVESLEQPGI